MKHNQNQCQALHQPRQAEKNPLCHQRTQRTYLYVHNYRFRFRDHGRRRQNSLQTTDSKNSRKPRDQDPGPARSSPFRPKMRYGLRIHPGQHQEHRRKWKEDCQGRRGCTKEQNRNRAHKERNVYHSKRYGRHRTGSFHGSRPNRKRTACPSLPTGKTKT